MFIPFLTEPYEGACNRMVFETWLEACLILGQQIGLPRSIGKLEAMPVPLSD